MALLVLGLPLAAAAQRVTITSTVGGYLPLRQQTQGVIYRCQEDWPCPELHWRIGLRAGTAFGMKVAVEWDGVIGIEMSVATAASDRVRQATGGQPPEWTLPTTTAPARTTVTALRLTMTKAVAPRASVAFGAGFSRIHLSGTGYETGDPITDRTRLGPTAGAAFRFSLAPRARFELGVTSTFYSLDTEGPSWERRAFRQHDLLVSGGLALALGN